VPFKACSGAVEGRVLAQGQPRGGRMVREGLVPRRELGGLLTVARK
jgi:hypothetical protein